MSSENVSATPIKFSVTDAALAALENKYSSVPDASTADGYEAAKAALKVLTPLRTGVEARRKELKADALEYGRKVDAEAKRITDRISAVELPIKEAKKQVDDEKKRIKEERLARLQSKVDSITAYPQTAFGLPSEAIAEMLDDLENIEIEDFYELSADAGKAKARALEAMTEMFNRAVAQESEAARLAIQQEAMRKQQEELDRQRAELAAMQAQQQEEAARLAQQQPEPADSEPVAGWEPELEVSAPEQTFVARSVSLLDSLDAWADMYKIPHPAYDELLSLLQGHGITFQGRARA